MCDVFVLCGWTAVKKDLLGGQAIVWGLRLSGSRQSTRQHTLHEQKGGQQETNNLLSHGRRLAGKMEEAPVFL
jgi:hypothetical protein